MAIQDFTAGQILTAAQMDSLQANDYNQTVSTKTANYTLVAADKGTRIAMNAAGATTITVNTSLFSAGDTLQLQNIGAGVCTVTAGTATVSSAGPLAIPQYGSGTLFFSSASVAIFFPSAGPAASSGLTLISATTIGTTVSSVTVTGAFSSTYDNYLVTVSGGIGSTSSAMRLTLGATATGYYLFGVYNTYTAATLGAINSSNGTFWDDTVGVSANSLSGVFNLIGPNLAKRTSFNNVFVQTATAGYAAYTAGYLNDDTQYTAFTLTVGSGTVTGGTIRVYGYQNSQVNNGNIQNTN